MAAAQRSLTLRIRLLFLVAMATAPAAALIVHGAWQHRDDALSSAHAGARQLARLAAKEHEKAIESGRAVLETLAQIPAVSQLRSRPACEALVSKVLAGHPSYANIGVIQADGRVFCSALPVPDHLNLADRPYFRRAMETHRFAVGDYQVGRIPGLPGLNLAQPLLDARGRSKAVIFLSINLSWLGDLAKTVQLPPGVVLTAVDSEGTILARLPAAPHLIGSKVPEADRLEQVASASANRPFEAPDLEGVVRLWVYAPIYSGETSALYTRVGTDRNAVLAPVRRGIFTALSILAAVAVATVVLAIWGARLFVMKPLRAISDAVRALGEGKPGARTGLAHGDDEFGRLARAFDEMAAGIEVREARLAQLTESLQRSVRALRTVSKGNRTLLHAQEEHELCSSMCRVAVEVGGYRLAWVGYAQHDDQKSIRPVAWCGADGEFVSGLRASWADHERGMGIAGSAIRTGQVSYARDIRSEARVAPWREEALRHELLSGIAFPLIVDGSVIGAYSIYAAEPDAFDQEETEILQENALDLAFGIAMLRLREKQRKADEQIRFLAFHDSLTHLPNRTRLVQRLESQIEQAGRSGTSLALAAFDVDRFSDVNEALGYDHGDRLLGEIGSRLTQTAPPQGIVCRLGEDEFGVLMPGMNTDAAIEAVRRMLQAFDSPFELAGLQIDVRASAGIATFPTHGASADLLISRATTACGLAKRSGNPYEVGPTEAPEATARRLALAGELRRGIETSQLALFVQPKIAIATRSLCGAEALARWTHAQYGPIAPAEFVQLAERTGLIRSLTYWVLQTAARHKAAWREAGLGLPIAVNISARNLRDPELVRHAEKTCAALGLEPGAIELEITESALMDDPARALKLLQGLRDIGFQLAIDDFGTGYSSLGYLERFPVNAIKIDRSFVANMLSTEGSALIVRSTVDLAHNLGLTVTAEGVESADILDRLRDLGCDVAQGYFIARPFPAEQMPPWHDQSAWTG